MAAWAAECDRAATSPMQVLAASVTKKKEKDTMQHNERDQQEREATENAYRRGWTQGIEEASRLVLQLGELGYKPTEIKRFLAVYDDHFLAPWRHDGDLSKRTAPPPFNINECQAILEQTTGYDWIV